MPLDVPGTGGAELFAGEGVTDKLDGGAVPVDVVFDEVGACELTTGGFEVPGAPVVNGNATGVAVVTLLCKVGTAVKGVDEAFNELGIDVIVGTGGAEDEDAWLDGARLNDGVTTPVCDGSALIVKVDGSELVVGTNTPDGAGLIDGEA